MLQQYTWQLSFTFSEVRDEVMQSRAVRNVFLPTLRPCTDPSHSGNHAARSKQTAHRHRWLTP